MIVDSDLQLRPDWKKLVGPEISGKPNYVAPDVYGIDQSSPYARFYTQGKADANWLAGLSRPILPNTGNLELSFTLILDSLVSLYARCLEFDTRICKDKIGYNFSAQINIQAGWKLQISDVTGLWVDAVTVGKLPALVPIPVSFTYKFDFTKKTYSTISATIAGKKYVIPAKLQNFAATPLNWDDSCNLQVQQDTGDLPGSFSQTMTNVKFSWS